MGSKSGSDTGATDSVIVISFCTLLESLSNPELTLHNVVLLQQV